MRFWRPLLALLTVFALTGCMKVQMDMSIDSEVDAVSGSMIFAIDKQVLALSGKPAEETFGNTAKNLKQLQTGTRSEVYDDGKFYGRKVFFDKVAFAEFNKTDPGSPRFEHRDGKYYFTMDGDMSKADLGTAQGAAAKPILDQIEMKVSVTFPGKVIERDNLATLDGNTVSWTVKMSSGHQFKAVSEEPSKLRWVLVAGVGGLFGILVVAGIVVLAIRLNRKPDADPAAAQEPTAVL
jgi:LppM domain